MMRNERWDLICEGQPIKLAELVSYIFSNQYIYVHPSFRKILQADRKGYIHIDQLLKQDLVAQFFQTNLTDYQNRIEIIRYVVEQFCHHLLFKNNRVRRVTPFDHHEFKNIKPVCIQKLQSKLTISDIRDYLGQTAFSPIEYFDPQDNLQFLYVYAPHYRQKWYLTGNPPFKIIEYQRLCDQRDRESRCWSKQQIGFYKGIDLQEITQKTRREQIIRRQFQQSYSKFGRNYQMDQQNINEENEERSLDQLKRVLRPNLELNHLLKTFIANMQERLDEQ